MGKKNNTEGASAELAPLSHEEVGAKYFSENENCPVDSIHVTDDGVVFYNTLKGTNSCDNYCNEKGIGYQTVNK